MRAPKNVKKITIGASGLDLTMFGKTAVRLCNLTRWKGCALATARLEPGGMVPLNVEVLKKSAAMLEKHWVSRDSSA